MVGMGKQSWSGEERTDHRGVSGRGRESEYFLAYGKLTLMLDQVIIGKAHVRLDYSLQCSQEWVCL